MSYKPQTFAGAPNAERHTEVTYVTNPAAREPPFWEETLLPKWEEGEEEKIMTSAYGQDRNDGGKTRGSPQSFFCMLSEHTEKIR